MLDWENSLLTVSGTHVAHYGTLLILCTMLYTLYILYISISCACENRPSHPREGPGDFLSGFFWLLCLPAWLLWFCLRLRSLSICRSTPDASSSVWSHIGAGGSSVADGWQNHFGSICRCNWSTAPVTSATLGNHSLPQHLLGGSQLVFVCLGWGRLANYRHYCKTDVGRVRPIWT